MALVDELILVSMQGICRELMSNSVNLNSRSALAGCSISNLNSKPAQPGVTAYHSFSSYNRRSFDISRKVSMSLGNKEQPNNFFSMGISHTML